MFPLLHGDSTAVIDLYRGCRLVTATGHDLTDGSDPAKVMIRQVLGAFAEYEKAKLVQRLQHGRNRVRATQGKCEGRKSHAELNPELVREARRLSRRNPKTGRTRSLREIAAELERLGYVAGSGKAFGPSAVHRLLGKGA